MNNIRQKDDKARIDRDFRILQDIVSIDEKDYLLQFVDWKAIAERDVLSEDFIRKYIHFLPWRTVWVYQRVSEKFIEDYIDQAWWYYICQHQKLSIEFLRKHSDRIEWDAIGFYKSCGTTNLTKEVLYEFFDEIRMNYAMINYWEENGVIDKEDVPIIRKMFRKRNAKEKLLILEMKRKEKMRLLNIASKN